MKTLGVDGNVESRMPRGWFFTLTMPMEFELERNIGDNGWLVWFLEIIEENMQFIIYLMLRNLL